MTHAKRLALGGIIALAITVAAVALITWRRPEGVRLVTGAVLTADTNPQRQRPVAQARVSAVAGASSASGTTDEAGLFRLTLDPPAPADQSITLKVAHPQYHPFDASNLVANQLHLVRLRPMPAAPERASAQLDITIANVRVRYTSKAEATVEIASAARTFEFANTANVPCAGQGPCSPDGRWKATIGSFSLEAGPNRQFRNVRVSCLAGPCPFTRVASDDFSRGGEVIRGTVLNWSDSVTYLVEAEVAQHMVSDLVRHAYPAIFERFMNFTLPPGAQGPSIEAEVKGEAIIFPLGPMLRLSWATCRLDARDDGTRLYRCELKPGFTFKP
jgi:hypothetical protein